MSKGSFLLATFLLATTFPTRAQTAPVPLQVRMLCYDIIVHAAKIRLLGGIEDINQVSSQGQFNPANDEMAFAPIDVPTTHWGTFLFTDIPCETAFRTVLASFGLRISDSYANDLIAVAR